MTSEEHILFPAWDSGSVGSADASGMPAAPAPGSPVPGMPEPNGSPTPGAYQPNAGSVPAFLENAGQAPAHFAEPSHRALDGAAEESEAEACTLFGAQAAEQVQPAAPAPVATPDPTAAPAPVATSDLTTTSAPAAASDPTAAPTPTPDPANVPVPDPADIPAPTPEHAAAEAPASTPHEDDSPETTAEIDVAAVEARLDDPGSTQSFAPLTEERINTDSTYDAGTSTSLMWGARSDVGCVRTHNEDSYLVQSPLFCVCDGMGGHAAGEVASSIAVETIARLAPHEADATRLAAAVEAANAAIIEAAQNGLGKPGMGCTATAAYIEGNTIAIAHVGDSRAYLLHEGSLIRITHDHSYVEELVDAGEITADEARVHPNRSVITRALGSDPAMYADHFQLNIEEGDRLILCSDGLSSMISDGEIETIATQSPTAQICTDNLVDAALNAGGTDNVTVVVVDVVDDGRMRDLARRRKRNICIAIGGLVAAIIVALAVSAFVISNSVYLGVKDGCVAIYTGIPHSFMGIELYHLSDETGIDINDLPEDTQNRLRAGISVRSMDEALDTVSEYRQQIYNDQTRAAQDAAAIHGGTSATANNATTSKAGSGNAAPQTSNKAATHANGSTDATKGGA